jgi:hypothetical protein
VFGSMAFGTRPMELLGRDSLLKESKSSLLGRDVINRVAGQLDHI